MKKLLIVLIVSVLSSIGSGYAQIENVPITKNITADKIYAGILSWTSASIDSLHAVGYAGFRGGAVGTWRPSNWIAVRSLGVFQLETGNKSWAMNQFSLILNPWKNLTITTGNMATLVTEQRPSPATSGGQFETFTEAQIPGMALGTKVVWDVAKNVSFGGAVAERENHPEYQLMFGWKTLKVSGFYRECDKKFGGVLSADFWRISDILVFNQGNVISNIFQLFLGKNRDWCLYSDTGYDLVKKDLVRGEWGILKTFSAPYIGGLIGPGYCHEDRSVHCYLYLHLAKAKKQ